MRVYAASGKGARALFSYLKPWREKITRDRIKKKVLSGGFYSVLTTGINVAKKGAVGVKMIASDEKGVSA